jgi:GNAT superfamily N-acetyltransferase
MIHQDKEQFPFSDLTLSRRLERTEGKSNAWFVEARAAISPESGAQWIEVAGAYAMFDTPSSPLTQTFGLGVFQPATGADLDTIEEFYKKRAAPVFHEVSPLADLELLKLLNDRGYRPIELTSVMYRPISRDLRLTASRNEKIQVRTMREGEQELWATISTRGWDQYPDLSDFLQEIGVIFARRAGAVSFFAELDGEPIATGALCICDGVGLLAGACTVPEGRRQGAQLALLERRLRYAAEQGCDIAMMCALPGSASQRNAERHGFRIAYTRIKWQLAFG